MTQAYRALLAELQTELRSEARSIRVSSAIREVDDATRQWGDHLDPRHRVDHINRKAEFAKLPRRGWLFALLGFEGASIRIQPLSGMPACIM
jgi:hypothetical protein